MAMTRRLLSPYLMGQRRNGLARVAQLDQHAWELVALDDATAERITDKSEQMRSMGRIYARLAERVCDAAAAGQRPLSIAGDCVSTLGVLAGLQQAGRQPQRILWLDAHGDFHTWGTTQTQYLGGMPLAMLVGRSDRRRHARDDIHALRATVGVRPYPEAQLVLSDARDLDPGEDEALAQSAIVRCDLDEVLTHLSPHESLYVHFDTDVLDARQEMPALKYHVPHGPSLADMATLFTQLRNYPLVAVSVSAWHADQDKDDQAARACLNLLQVLLPG
ncbi:arginase family protein [Chitinimonas sp.]|uniref:arginase family protein n=1 Tax=Chitinimonas sp. TaxID=1934313 RepID=UPI002F959747